jgi:hypothetical protein
MQQDILSINVSMIDHFHFLTLVSIAISEKGEHIFWKKIHGYYCFLLKFQVDP